MKQKKTDHVLYSTWANMRQRCLNTNNPDYQYYGGKGVTICEEWRDFWTFVQDVGEKPEGMTLDRIDGDGDYEPGNVKWSTKSEQNFNRRYNRRRKFMNKSTKKTESSEQLPVRRRNTQGRTTTAMSVTIPTELNQRINGIAVKTKKSRSLVITELIEKGFENYGE